MMHHSWQFASFGLVLFWIILTPGVITAADVGGSYGCSPSWTNSEKVTITFRIDRSLYPSKCAINTTAGKPVFQTSPDGIVTYGANCTVTTDIRTSCTFTPGTIGCGCTNSDDNGFYVVEYNFIFGPDYHRYWEAEIACLDKANFSPVFSFTNTPKKSCNPVALTPTPPPPEPCCLCACREGCAGWCAGCICIIIVVFIIILICTCCLSYCCCRAAPGDCCCCCVAPGDCCHSCATPGHCCHCCAAPGRCCCSLFLMCLYRLFDRCLKCCHGGHCIPEDKHKPTCPPPNKPAGSEAPDGKPDGTCPPPNKPAGSEAPDGKPHGAS